MMAMISPALDAFSGMRLLYVGIRTDENPALFTSKHAGYQHLAISLSLNVTMSRDDSCTIAIPYSPREW
jgi:hypothetical protein